MMTSHLIDHIEKLKHFLAIAEAGSFAQAAKKLSMTQPTLSHTVKVLEEVLGIELFYRSSSGIRLTDAGEYLCRFGKKLLAEVNEVEQALTLREEAYAGRVRFGVKEPFAVIFWAEYLALFETGFPDVEFSLTIRRSNQDLIGELLHERLEIIVLPDPRPHEDLIAYEMFRDSLSFFASPEYFKKTRGTPIEELPLYFFQKSLCGGGKTVDAVIKKQWVPLPLARDVDSHSVAKNLCLSSLGIALLPKSFVKKEQASQLLVELPYPGIDPAIFGETVTCLCLNRRTAKNRLLKSLLRTLRTYHKAPCQAGVRSRDCSRLPELLF